MLLGGCSNVSQQTLAYSEITQKFTFVGDAHAFVFDTKGQSRLDTIIPFCEKIQHYAVGQIKQTALLKSSVQQNVDMLMISGLTKSFVVGKESEKFVSFLSGYDLAPEVWGGVGVSCIDWHPTEPNMLAALTLKTNQLEIWKVDCAQMVAIMVLVERVGSIQWNPNNPAQLMARILDSNEIYLIDYKADSIKTHKIYQNDQITTALWAPNMPGHIFVGSAMGRVILYEINSQKKKQTWQVPKLIPTQLMTAAVQEIIPNPGEPTIMVIRKDGAFFVFGQDNEDVAMTFEAPPGGGTSRIVWIDSVSGDFLVASKKAGVLRLYNVAMSTCKEIIKVSRHGIYDIKKMNNEVYLIRLKNGQVSQFNIRTKRTLFTTDIGHQHQIQRVIIHPSNCDVMISAGFDGTIRKWNLKNMQMDQMFEDRKAQGRDSVIQSLAWCKMKPPRGQADDAFAGLVCAGTSAGTVKLVDLGRNKVLVTMQVSRTDETVFALDWNTLGFLAIGTTDWKVLVKKFDTATMNFVDVVSIPAQNSCRCLSWNPNLEQILAIGLFDGRIIIYDVEQKQFQQTLQGTNSRILCLEWHPQFDYILAAGSFDNIVRVHDTKFTGHKELEFHSDRVRALLWSTEIPWMLTSGADDSKQAVWDIRNKQLIYSTEETSLALTSFTVHPERPFSYFSSHFDASIIQWSMHGLPDVALAQLKFLLGCPEIDCLCEDAHQIMMNDISAKVTGQKSRELFNQTKNVGTLERCQKVLKFFQGMDGQEELWAMAHIIKGDGPDLESEKLRVHHISDVAAAYSSKAQNLLNANPMSMLGTAFAKKEDRLQEAARLNLVSGNFQQYCEIMMQLGNFEDALSVAPKVSLKYWQKCLELHRQHLNTKMNQAQASTTIGGKNSDPVEEYVEYSILAGDYDAATKVLENSRQTNAAKTVKFLQLSRGFPQNKVAERHRGVPIQDSNAPQAVSLFDLGPDQKELKSFTDREAKRQFALGSPLLSAASHLSLNDTTGAIHKLMMANLPEFAFPIAKEFMPKALDQVLVLLFNKTVFYSQMSLTNAIINEIKNHRLKEIMEISLYLNAPDANVGEIRQANSSSAQDSTSVFDLIVSQRLDDAVNAAINNYHKCAAQGNPSINVKLSQQVLEDLYFLSFLDMTNLQPDVYHELVSSYRDVAMLKALYWGLFPLFRWLCQHTSQMIQSPLYSVLKDLSIITSDEELYALLQSDQNNDLSLNLAILEEHLQEYMPSMVGNFRPGDVVHMDTHRKKSVTREQSLMNLSFISQRPISHHDIRVQVGTVAGESFLLSLEDSLDLALCMSFDPLNMQKTERFNPFKLHFEQQLVKGKLGFYV